MRKILSVVVCFLMCIGMSSPIFAASTESPDVMRSITIQEAFEPVINDSENVIVYDQYGTDVTQLYLENIRSYYAASQWDEIMEYTKNGNYKIIHVLEEKTLPSTRGLGISKTYKSTVNNIFDSKNGNFSVGVIYTIQGTYTVDQVHGLIISASKPTLLSTELYDPSSCEYTATDLNTDYSIDKANNTVYFEASQNIVVHYRKPLWGQVWDYDMGVITQSISKKEIV